MVALIPRLKPGAIEKRNKGTFTENTTSAQKSTVDESVTGADEAGSGNEVM